MTANSSLTNSIPSVAFGDGTTCPGCGVPFFSERHPNSGPERAVDTGIMFHDIDATDTGAPTLREGSLILCESCIKVLAAHVDMIDAEKGKIRASDVRRADRRTKAIRDAAEKREAAQAMLEAALEALRDLEKELRA